MKNTAKALLLFVTALVILLLAVGLGSVFLPPAHILQVVGHKLFGLALPSHIPESTLSIVWSIRLPRVVMGFLVGASLAVSGTVMQSVLQNPLASSFTLGVSSGAALGAALVMLTGLSFLGVFTLPLVSFLFSLATVALALALAGRIDRGLHNQTIVLIGMVLSLFLNGILTFVTSFFTDRAQQLVLWQMGSLTGKKWSQVLVLLPITLMASALLWRFHREMDLLAFGETRAKAMGLAVQSVKWVLLTLAALLTGASVSFSGVIGFVDLIAPHIMRRLFGPSHRWLVPTSALFGGTFLVLADLIARTVLAPVELSVGAVTALVGAPFFAYVFFRSRKQV